MALEVLVVDDEADIRELVSGVLEDEGYAVRSAADSTAALEAIDERRPSMVLLDVWLQGSRLDGLQLLQEIKRRDASLPVLLISGHGNLDTAVAAVREGAVDFIEKPFEAERLVYLVDRTTETDRLKRENVALRKQVGQDEQLNGSSVAINTVRATLKRVAPTGSRVLITGPGGVGKEIAARMIHQWSPRAKAPFIVVSAAMMSPDRVEEELFGSELDGEARPGLAVDFGTEQFLFDPVRAHHRRRQHDERRLRSRAPLVDHPRGDLLADAAGAGDQHPAAGRSDALQRRPDGIDRHRTAV